MSQNEPLQDSPNQGEEKATSKLDKMIDKLDTKEFGRRFLESFLMQGFGSLTKKEVEVLVLNLIKNQAEFRDKSNYALSSALQLPATKVANLLYEGVLLFEDDHEKYLQEGLVRALRKIRPKQKVGKSDETTFTFVLEDKFVRVATHAKLKDLGHFADGSFNTEIVSISFDALITLLSSFVKDDDFDLLVSQIKTQVDECKTKQDKASQEATEFLASKIAEAGTKISAKALFKNLLEGAAKKSGEALVAWLTGGGFNTIIEGSTAFLRKLTNASDEADDDMVV